MHRMHNAAQCQTETYKRNLSRHSSQSKKDAYAESIEEYTRANGAVYAGGGEQIIHGQSGVPLGKYVSQVEMKDPEARRRLKEMLEFQM